MAYQLLKSKPMVVVSELQPLLSVGVNQVGNILRYGVFRAGGVIDVLGQFVPCGIVVVVYYHCIGYFGLGAVLL